MDGGVNQDLAVVATLRQRRIDRLINEQMLPDLVPVLDSPAMARLS